MDPDIINYFHHIHHIDRIDGGMEHEVHHCGGDHAKIDPEEDYHCCDDTVRIDSRLGYNIRHCKCRKHSIDVKRAIGHDADSNEVIIVFIEPCPEGGFHIESGKVRS